MLEPSICKERILSEEYLDFIVSDIGTSFIKSIPPEGLCSQSADFGHQIVYLSAIQAEPMTLDKYTYNGIPKCYTLLDMEAMNQAGILQMQNYPTLQLKGGNVMIGFIDTGIDYENPIFRNLDDTTRVAGIWDQTVKTGVPPEGLLYGSEYTKADIDAALEATFPQSIVPSQDENGHGTYVTSLAAGGASPENQFIGAAPEATIGVVKLKGAKRYLRDFYFIKEDAACYQENDIILGLKYLNNLAKSVNMPLVICLALGTNMGGHNGTLPLPILLEAYGSLANRIAVVGVGNEANQRHHFEAVLENEGDRKNVEIRVGEGARGFTMELWTDIPNILSVALVSPSGESTFDIPIRAGTSTVFDFLFEKTRVYIDYRLLVERTNSELIFFRFDRPTPGMWKLIVKPVKITDGRFHIWLPVTEFLSGEVHFLESNPNYTLVNPANVQAPIVAAYYNGTDRGIAINSGRGYTRSGRMKPDLAAPGVNVLGALPGGRFVRRTGSSAGVAITAGAVALVLEWLQYQIGNPRIDAIQVKSLLILGTVRIPGVSYPNREWGYGMLDLYNMFEQFRQF